MNEPRPPAAALPEEQLQVVVRVVEGWTDRRIANHLSISVSSVKRRIRAANRALGSDSRVGLAVRAVTLGIVEAPALPVTRKDRTGEEGTGPSPAD